MPKTSLEVYVLAPRWPEARAAAVSLARASRLLATEAKGQKLLSDDPTNASALKPSAAKSQDRCIAALLFKVHDLLGFNPAVVGSWALQSPWRAVQR